MTHQGNMDLRGVNSPSEYLSKYPECCTIRRKPELSFTEKIFGEPEGRFPSDFSVEIAVQKKTFSIRKFATVLYDINGCGEIIETYEIDRRSLEVE